MLSDVPNFAFTIGYTNASWTLKADLVGEYVVRLLRHMDEHGYDVAVPANDDPSVTERPLLDFDAGYVLRSIDEFPRAGSRAPWQLGMSYAHDVVNLRHGKVGETQLIQAATLEEIQSSQMTIPAKPERADISPPSYGMGWVIDTYRGHRRLQHGARGFNSLSALQEPVGGRLLCRVIHITRP